jgi:hypothetical protein
LAVRQEWKSVEDCIKFWSTDYKDTTADKVALMQQLVQIPSNNFANAFAFGALVQIPSDNFANSFALGATSAR